MYQKKLIYKLYNLMTDRYIDYINELSDEHRSSYMYSRKC